MHLEPGMTSTAASSRALLLAPALLGLACSAGVIDDDGAGDDDGPDMTTARLAIVGDRNVVLGLGDGLTLTVKYTDASGRPLAGAVAFAVQGRAVDSSLAAATVVTDAQGLAAVDLTAGTTEGPFGVRASAENAAPVDWQVVLQGENLPVLAAVGTYELESQFDLISGLPGDAGEIVNTIIDLTDDPYDPASFILDELGGAAEDIIDPLRPFVDALIYEIILQYSPTLLEDLIAIANVFGDVSKRFGLISELTVAQRPGAQELVGTHRLLGVAYTVDGVRQEFTVDELGWDPIEATGVPVTLDAGRRLVVGDPSLEVSYGSMMVFALRHVLIPQVVPGVASLGGLLDRAVDCDAIGWQVSDALGLDWVGALIFAEACSDLADEAGDEVEDAIRDIGGDASAIVVHGDAAVRDTNGDQMVDRLQAGLWEGEYRLGPVSARLERPMQRFAGNRVAGHARP